jgi:hypothetical protein
MLQVEKPSDITAADKLIFPGVGSFGQAVEVLQQRDYAKPLVEYIQVRQEIKKMQQVVGFFNSILVVSQSCLRHSCRSTCAARGPTWQCRMCELGEGVCVGEVGRWK